MAVETVLAKIQTQTNTLMFDLQTNAIILKNLRQAVLKPGNQIKQKDWFVRVEDPAFDSNSRIQHSTVRNCPAAALVPKVMQFTTYHKYRCFFEKVSDLTKFKHYPTGHPFSAKAFFIYLHLLQFKHDYHLHKQAGARNTF